jgi:hypothetical protein
MKLDTFREIVLKLTFPKVERKSACGDSEEHESSAVDLVISTASRLSPECLLSLPVLLLPKIRPSGGGASSAAAITCSRPDQPARHIIL